MNEQQQSQFNGWARVEVMGHQTHIGYVKTEAYGAAVLFRIDTPPFPEREYTLASPEFAELGPGMRHWCPAGTVVKRKGRDPVSVLVGAASIYRIIPCTEEAAMAAIDREQRAELMLVKLPDDVALPAPEVTSDMDAPFEDDEDDPDEICEECGRPMERCNC